MIFEKIFDYSNGVSFILNQLATVYKSPQEKFKLLESVNNNIFFSSAQRDNFLKNFQKMQKIYFSFNKFIFLISQKKNIVNFDMNLSPIYEGSKNIITLNHYNTGYLFSIIDLIKIIELSLCNADYLFSKPQPIKNPFDNKEFSKSNLYNIYFFIKFKTYFHSELFHKFFLENFHITSFKFNYEYLLREKIIKNFVFTSSFKSIKKEIIIMIEEYYFSQNSKKKYLSSFDPINQDFPVDILIKTFKPYLYIYYQSKYSLVHYNKTYNYNKFIYQMQQFWKFNPKFGRKYISVKSQKINFKKSIRVVNFKFDDKHIQYNKNIFKSLDYNAVPSHINRVSNIRNNNSLLINSLLQINLQPAYEEEEDDEEEEDSLS